MELSAENFAMLVIEKRKILKSVGIESPDGKVNKSPQEGRNYKYLGILEADKFLGGEMKLNWKLLRNILEGWKNSRFNGGNLVQGVNTFAVFILRYSAAFTSWRKCEL